MKLNQGQESRKIINALIFVVVGIALIPVVQGLAASANVTGDVATIVSLIPFLFTLGVLVGTVKGMF